MESHSEPLIDAEHAAFLQGAVSIHVASNGTGLVPSQARALGCVVASSLKTVTLFVPEPQALELLADIRAAGPVAAVFSRPSSNRTIQLKALGAQVRPLRPQELQVVQRYRQAFISEVEAEGFPANMVAAMLHCADNDLIAIAFTPVAAFSQTPGPRAGEPLKTASPC
jgi:hypothetical protein